MSEERKQVLELLAAGKITPEQADELLDALGPDPELAGARRNEPSWHRDPGPARSSRLLRESRPARAPRLPREVMQRLTEAAIHGVDQKFIRELSREGITNLSLDELIELRIHGVSARYISEMRDAGFGDLSAKDLAELSIHGVTPEFVREMAEIGFADVDMRQLKEMAMFGVNPAFIEEMGDLAMPGARTGSAPAAEAEQPAAPDEER